MIQVQDTNESRLVSCVESLVFCSAFAEVGVHFWLDPKTNQKDHGWENFDPRKRQSFQSCHVEILKAEKVWIRNSGSRPMFLVVAIAQSSIQ